MAELKWIDGDGVEQSLRRCQAYGSYTFHVATAADIVACLKANPEALTAEQWAEVLSALPAETQDGITDALLDAGGKWGSAAPARTHAGMKARAEQAERQLHALRDQVEHHGCAGSHLAETVYTCDATAPCGLCSLRHRAEQAERERDKWREKWEKLEMTRAMCCDQMERERDEARAALADAERRALCVGVDALPTDATVIKTSNLEALRSVVEHGVELVSHAAPLGWVAATDTAGAQEWEKRAASWLSTAHALTGSGTSTK